MVSGSTQKITFSSDSTLAIVEADTSSVFIVNLTDGSTFTSIPSSEEVLSAHFLNTSNNFIVIFGVTKFVVVDLALNLRIEKTYSGTVPTHFTADYSNSVFTCTNGLIYNEKITIESLVEAQNPSSTPTETFSYPLVLDEN